MFRHFFNQPAVSMFFRSILWLLSTRVCVNGQFDYRGMEPDADRSCFIALNNANNLFVTCPTEIYCTVSTYLLDSPDNLTRSDTHIASCQSMDSKPLETDKSRQLQAVFRVVRLSQEPECEFSSVTVLNINDNQRLGMGQLGKGNSSVSNNSVCPYKLKTLNLSSKIERLLNHSFCQFTQLRILLMVHCSVGAIESDAFICLTDLNHLDLTSNFLTHLPRDLFRSNVHLEHVNLQYNWLQTEAFNMLFPIQSLLSLYLNGNNIKIIDSYLMGPGNLTTLDLSQNNISQVHQRAFQHLHSVTDINLSDNKIAHLHSDTFKHNLKLVWLYLNKNKLMRVPPVGHISSLKLLMAANNKISSIHKIDLINCSQLYKLDLSNNVLRFIEDGCFENIRRIDELNLTGNLLSEWTANFRMSNINNLELNFNNYTTFSYQTFSSNLLHLRLSFNQIKAIVRPNYTIVPELSLALLDLSYNRIESMDNLTLPPSIQHISLRGNRLRRALTGYDVDAQKLNLLKSVDLRSNSIELLCQRTFSTYPKTTLVRYYISENPLRCSMENVWIKSLDHVGFIFADISVAYCQDLLHVDKLRAIDTLATHDFLCESLSRMTVPRSRCYPDANRGCLQICPTNCTCLSTNTKTELHFLCNNNNFKQVSLDLQYVPYYSTASITLNLSNNSIPLLTAIDFGTITHRYVELYLSNCSIWAIDESAFEKLIKLQVLDLAYNRLQVLPERIFQNLTNLVHLDLSNNQLQHIADDAFASLLQLNMLKLNNNSLNVISVSQLRQLPELKSISLQDNPWSCACDFVDSFRTFILDSSKDVEKNIQIDCVENEQHINVAKFNMKLCVKQIIHITALIVSLAFAFVLMAAFVLMFKCRYEIQVLVYSRLGLRMFHRMQPEDDCDKQYDAFIAYNSNDDEFLVNQLMPGLEAIDRPYRLCIHERDFPAGSYIQDSILDAIRLSSRTIVILSENFVKSGWCRYEFKSAHMQMLQDRCPRILVIMLGEMPETLDPEMQLYLKTNTYLKWGEKLFWEKLYYALPDQRVTTPATEIMPT